MTLTYRTTGAWGSGKGSDLTPIEVDNNFYNVDSRITIQEFFKPKPIGITSISTLGNDLYFNLENNTSFGPYKQATNIFTSKFQTSSPYLLKKWQPNHQYKIGDVFYNYETSTDGYYVVLSDHTSDATFSKTKKYLNQFVYGKYEQFIEFGKQNNSIPIYQYRNRCHTDFDYLIAEGTTLTAQYINLTINSFFTYKGKCYLAIRPMTFQASDLHITAQLALGNIVLIDDSSNYSFNDLLEATPIEEGGGLFLQIDGSQNDKLKWAYPRFIDLLARWTGANSFTRLGSSNSAYNNYLGKYFVLTSSKTNTFKEFSAIGSLKDLNLYNSNAGMALVVDEPNNTLTNQTFALNYFIQRPDTFSYYSGLNDRFLKVSASESEIQTVIAPTNTFVSKTDSPGSFSGNASKYLTINSQGTGLSYTSSANPPFVNLIDAPQSYANSASKFLSTNANGDGVEFVDGVSGNPKSTLTYLSTQTPSGVTNIEFLNIPNTARRIFIMFSGLKASSNADFIIQFGNSGGYVATGYTSFYSYLRTGLNGSSGLLTTGFLIQSGVSTNVSYGFAKIELLDSATSLWVYNYTDALIQNNNTYFTTQGGGSKTLGAGVDVTKIKIVSSNGTDTFASGSTLSLAYE